MTKKHVKTKPLQILRELVEVSIRAAEIDE